MAVLMSYSDWKEGTNTGTFSTRSSELKKLDKAIEAYHHRPVTQREVFRALQIWIKSKERQNKSWRQSARNKRNGAVEKLYNQLTVLSPADARALAALNAAPQETLKLLFAGAEVSWKNAFADKISTNLINPRSDENAVKLSFQQYKNSASTNKFGVALNSAGATKASMSIHKSRSGAPASPGAIQKLISSVVPSAEQAAVMTEVRKLFPKLEGELAANAAPLLGVVTAAGAAGWNWLSAGRKQNRIMNANTHHNQSLAGTTPSAAIQAMINLIKRERNADIFSASVSTAELGGKLATMAVDGGMASHTAIGLAANVAKLLNVIRIVYRDVKEKKEANAALKGNINLFIFDTSPIVGCYMVCCAPTSVLMSLITHDIGKEGWMDKAEAAAKHIDPLRKEAQSLIAGHRFEIKKLANHAGVRAASSKAIAETQKRAAGGNALAVGFGRDG